jgi:hypothetical protein
MSRACCEVLLRDGFRGMLSQALRATAVWTFRKLRCGLSRIFGPTGPCPRRRGYLRPSPMVIGKFISDPGLPRRRGYTHSARGFNPISANLMKASARRMYFVPEGQHDRSQVRSAWESVHRGAPQPTGSRRAVTRGKAIASSLSQSRESRPPSLATARRWSRCSRPCESGRGVDGRRLCPRIRPSGSGTNRPARARP